MREIINVQPTVLKIDFNIPPNLEIPVTAFPPAFSTSSNCCLNPFKYSESSSTLFPKVFNPTVSWS